MKTYYLSKYALSSNGRIKLFEGREPSSKGYISSAVSSYGIYRLGSEVHETPEEAIASADLERVKKIASLKNQLEKLEKMTFKVEGA